MKFKQIRNLYEGVKRQIKEVRDAFYMRRDSVIQFIETPINEEAIAGFNVMVKISILILIKRCIMMKEQLSYYIFNLIESFLVQRS